MKEINILNNNIINKIAAGEVVERPSSVVKELVENSIDSGASLITIESKDSGLSLIRVSDNGKGISKEDVKDAFLRHATSKIKNITDLESIITLGFRGEALSSIASVSKLEMISKSENESLGNYIEISGGNIEKVKNIGAARGTTIIVRNLFYNVPARRKFLKSPSTESSYISDIVTRFALGNPNISFRYFLNGKKIIHTDGKKDLKRTIFQIYGKNISKNMLEVNYKENNLKIDGFIGKLEIARNNRSYGSLFLNGRFIKSKTISSAIEEAFKTKLPIGKFPFYVINFYLDPKEVDVNVHPTKLEVRFSNETLISDFVLKAINKTLDNSVLIPSYETKLNSDNEKKYKNFDTYKEQDNFKYQESKLTKIKEDESVENYKNEKPNLMSQISYILDDKAPFCDYNSVKEPKKIFSLENKKDEENKDKLFNNYKIIGHFLSTYWAVEQNNNIYLIDQHAAHERILYEKLIKSYKSENIVSQKLLEPQIIKLQPHEKVIFLENKDIFEKLGFFIETFSDDDIYIISVPFIFKEGVDPNLFFEILDKLSKIDTFVKDIYNIKLDNIASISCKAAVKANDNLSYIEAKTLIENLLKLKNPFTCPHGRPTIVKLSKYELEKMFKRV